MSDSSELVQHVTNVLLEHERKVNCLLEGWMSHNEKLILRMCTAQDKPVQDHEALVSQEPAVSSLGKRLQCGARTHEIRSRQRCIPVAVGVDDAPVPVEEDFRSDTKLGGSSAGQDCCSAPRTDGVELDEVVMSLPKAQQPSISLNSCAASPSDPHVRSDGRSDDESKTKSSRLGTGSLRSHGTSTESPSNAKRGSLQAKPSLVSFQTKPSWITDALQDGQTRGHAISSAALAMPGAIQHTIMLVRGYNRSLYELVLAVVVVSNALWVGFQVQFEAVSRGDEHTRAAFHIGTAVFCVLFTIDLIIRFVAEVLVCRGFRSGFWSFFQGDDHLWNHLDGIVVFSMLMEQLLLALDNAHSEALQRVSSVRTLRLLRLLRVLRLTRVLALFHELRMIIFAIYRGLRAMCCILVVTIFMIYIVAILLTQNALDVCAAGQNFDNDVCKRFGTLFLSMISLFQALLAGIPWAELLDVVDELGAICSVMFVGFVCFGTLVVLNIGLAMFIDIQMETKRNERELIVQDIWDNRNTFVKRLSDLFYEIDINHSGCISKSELELAFEHPELDALFTADELGVQDVELLFQLLEPVDGGDGVSIEDFVTGCVKLRGHARAIDTAMLKLQVEAILSQIHEIRHVVKALPQARTTTRIDPPKRSVIFDEGTEGQDGGGTDAAFTHSLGSKFTSSVPIQMHKLKEQLVSLRSKAHYRRSISQVEMRAMSLDELECIRDYIALCCTLESWRSLTNEELLTPEMVNLYEFNHYHIWPFTVPNGIMLEVTRMQDCEEGARIVQREAGKLIAEGKVVKSTNGHSLHVEVTTGRFLTNSSKEELRTWCDDNDAGEVTSIEPVGEDISYKELISTAALKPEWFCSHWWGSPIFDFVVCCEGHSRLRHLRDGKASYWVCAYANRQHDLGMDITSDPELSSFCKAMRLASGVLLILDKTAMVFRRIWCDYELYRCLADGKSLDVVTSNSLDDCRNRPHLLSEQPLPNETPWLKAHREQNFPPSLLVAGMNVRLEQGAATIKEDRDHILRSMSIDIKKQKPVISQEEALEIALRQANASLNAYFAVAAWPKAVKNRTVRDFDQEHPGELSLPHILQQDEFRKILSLSLGHMREVDDAELQSLAHGLPASLEVLHLSFEDCQHITDGGVFSLAHQLPPGLRQLHLDFLGCEQVTDAGFGEISMSLPPGLVSLRLDFAKCRHITSSGVRVLAENLPKSLLKCAVTLKGSRCDRNFGSIKELMTNGRRNSGVFF